jgi:hypothetical protein
LIGENGLRAKAIHLLVRPEAVGDIHFDLEKLILSGDQLHQLPTLVGSAHFHTHVPRFGYLIASRMCELSKMLTFAYAAEAGGTYGHTLLGRTLMLRASSGIRSFKIVADTKAFANSVSYRQQLKKLGGI